MDEILEDRLRRSKNEWKWKVHRTLEGDVVPYGYLISYGILAQKTNQEHDTSINARNVAALRRELYDYYRPHPNYGEPPVPLHRIAKKGDVNSNEDSPNTKRENDHLRGEEGSLQSPRWVQAE